MNSAFLLANLLAMVFALVAVVWAHSRWRDKTRSFLVAGAVWAGAVAVGTPAIKYWLAAPQRAAERAKAQAEQVLLKRPEFRALKQYQPDSYTAWALVPAWKAKMEPGRPIPNEELRWGISMVLKNLLLRASDEAISAYVEATLDQLDVLKQKDGALCFSYLYPSPGQGIDGPKYFSPAQLDAESEASAAVIRTATESPQAAPNADQARMVFQPIVVKLANEFGSDWQMINGPYRADTDKAKLCRIVSRAYELTRQLPPEERSLAQRYWTMAHG